MYRVAAIIAVAPLETPETVEVGEKCPNAKKCDTLFGECLNCTKLITVHVCNSRRQVYRLHVCKVATVHIRIHRSLHTANAIEQMHFCQSSITEQRRTAFRILSSEFLMASRFASHVLGIFIWINKRQMPAYRDGFVQQCNLVSFCRAIKIVQMYFSCWLRFVRKVRQ